MQNRTDATEVALLIDTEDLWGRRIISGIARAVRGSLPWRLTIAPRDEQWRLRVADGWSGAGVISSIRDARTAEHVQGLDVPVVNVSSWGRNLNWASHVVTDDHDRATLAFDHLRSKGYERFAYYAPRALTHLRHRGAEFERLVTESGFPCQSFHEAFDEHDTRSDRELLQSWLGSLPTPTAILAANPQPALHLTQLCHELGYRVPYEFAVIASDTDDLICEISEPPISSINLGCERLGAMAVERLAMQLNNGSREISTVEIKPLGVIERQSTAALAFGDTQFVEAVEYLRQNATRGINVADVLQAVAISRRALEQQFVSLLGTSPAAEIRRIRTEEVKRLLRQKEMTMKEIAQATGYHSTAQLSRTFSREVGLTPTEFREQS